MPMNSVIQEKRKELGLTQEQVAEYLNVSIPAVSRWENGATSPDISLLPPLARLLKIDLNTLFCFQEDMTPQEIGYFCREVGEIAKTEGIAAGFQAAKQKLQEYPHSDTLLHCLTVSLDGLVTMSGLCEEEARPYNETLAGWYRRLSASSDCKIKNSADFMRASRLIRDGDYEKAQEILDQMPDREDLTGSMADRRILQINLWLCQGETEKARKALQSALLTAVNKVQMLLCKMVDAELAAGSTETAEDIAGRTAQMTALFDLWEYNSCVAPLQVAFAREDADTSISLLRKMLASMLTPRDMSRSPLFSRLANTSDQKQMLSAILSEMERESPAYGFLQSRDAFQELIAEYRAFTENQAGR